MFTRARAIAFTDFLHVRAIVALVGYIDHQPRNLLRLTTSLCDYGDHVSQRAVELLDKIRADDSLLLIPCDLSGDEKQTPAGFG
jgi:hypothetical protein